MSRRDRHSLPPEPIAIVGIGLRLPGGATDPASFWQFLLAGGDGVTEVPEDRWSIQSFHDTRVGLPGKTHSKWGGFIADHERFDASFFSVSPQEAAAMDPQQRWLLETAWHAFENSGRIPDPAAGERIGVWVGVSLNDYARFAVSPVDHVQSSSGGSGAYDATGNALSITANRLSHFFNLTGPSMAVDTACSSSLIALNEACRAIWGGECDSALVAGVNHIVDPTTWIAFCAMGALSPTGRCKSFDASADGFVRSEGVGAVVLKPLRRAEANGDRIYACIRATATNQDGRTPAIAMPSKAAQRSLIEHTLSIAGLRAEDIDFVEAHGTGTAIGDPIEANAIGEAIGRHRTGRPPLLLGSVKTNLGHLEAAAGITGLIKAALSLHHRVLPANRNFETPNPAVDFEGLNLTVPVRNTPLPQEPGRILRAGVNSFGFGGANAHAILESVPAAPAPPQADGGDAPGLLALSAASEASLRLLAAACAERLEAGTPLHELGVAARPHRLPHRLSAYSETKEDLIAKLKTFSDGDGTGASAAGIETARTDTRQSPAPVFVFSGQGSQWAGMGRRLHGRFPVFRKEFDRIAAALKRLSRGQIDLTLALSPEGGVALSRTALAQPAIFAIQAATARLLESWGIHPAAVVGHSVGEVAAAYIAGALSFEDAVRVIYHRGTKMESTRLGRMLAVDLPPDEADTLLSGRSEELAIAARNSPKSVSLSGPAEEIDRLRTELEARGIACRPIPVDYAFHSALMAPAEAKMIRGLAGIVPRRTHIPLYSTVTGARMTGTQAGPGYWWRNVRETVRFTEAMESLGKAGHRLFLEINAHPVLQPSIRQHRFGEGDETGIPLALGTLRKDRDDLDELFGTIAKLHCLAAPVDWQAFHGHLRHLADPLPYPFERRPFWRETPAWRLARTSARPHPLLHAHIPGPRPQWLVFLDRRHHPFFNDHLVGDRIVFPASGYLELALAVGRHHLGEGCLCLESVEFQRVLFLPHQSEAPLLRIEFQPETGAFAIHTSSDPDRKNWTRHAVGKVRKTAPEASLPDLGTFVRIRGESSCEAASVADTYAALEKGGLRYGPLFRGLSAGGWNGDECWSEITVPTAALDGNRIESFLLHPVLLDSAFHILALKPNKSAGTFLPVEAKRLRLHSQGATAASAYARLTASSEAAYEADIVLLDREGRLVADLRGFRLQAIESHRSRLLSGVSTDFIEERWVREDLPHVPVSLPSFPDTALLLKSLVTPPSDWRKAIQAMENDSAVVSARICLALNEEGWNFPKSGTFRSEDVRQALGAKGAKDRRRIEQLLGLLERTGFLSSAGDAWQVRANATPGESARIWSSALSRHSRLSTELLHLDRAASRLFRSASDWSDEDAAIHRQSLWSRPVRESVAAILRRLAEAQAPGRRLDILELDAASRSSAAWSLTQLPQGTFRYTATDPDPLRLAEFAERTGHHDSLRSLPFDPADSTKEDIAELACDVALWIHPARPTTARLKHLRNVLRPGGLLLLVAPSQEQEEAESALPGLEAFCPAAAPLRPLLERAGFADIVHRDPGGGPHRYWLARNPIAKAEKPSLPSANADASQPFLLFADRTGAIASAFAACLRDAGSATVVVPFSEIPCSKDDAQALLSTLDPATTLVYLEDQGPRRGVRASSPATLSGAPLFLAQALDTLGDRSTGLSLHVFTTGVQPIPGFENAPNLAHAPLSGFLRVVRNELRRHRIVQADLSDPPGATEIALAVRDLLAPSDEDQIAYRGESRWVPRLDRILPALPEAAAPRPLHERPSFLSARQPGILEHLALESCDRSRPGRGEVEIEIHAAGMNFRDVMKALAVYPSDARDARLLGDDFSGTVVSTGPGVRRLKTGDRVVGIYPGCFRTHFAVPEEAVFPIPDSLSHEEAATIPSVYLTAWFALHEVARIRRGERVLVHAGAGGVGLAAIRLALRAGAVVYATAGAEWKQRHLLALGVERVYSSRNLEFADQLLSDTGGEGVDIVLNSLAGEAIRKSLECLRERGRFLELGKRDIYGSTEISLSPFRNCLSYHAIDLSRQFDPASLRRLFRTLRTLVERDEIRPLPHTVLPIVSAAEVFRTMAQGRHLGKLVLSFDGLAQAPHAPFHASRLQLSPEGLHLVTGGTRGFGLRVARFLASRGARRLALVSLGGTIEPGGDTIAKEIRSLGATLSVHACDIGDGNALAALLREIRAEGTPIHGIHHSAMVLDDEVVLRLDPERIARVLRPKAEGAWNLHRLTLADPLRYFVLFSSISVLLGNPGQANYVAANAFLDTLASHRRCLGKPGLSVAFDRLAGSGHAARSRALSEHFDRMGFKGLSDEEACRGLELAMLNGATRLAVSNIDWSRWRSAGGQSAKSPRYRHLVEEGGEAADENLLERIRQRFFDTPPDGRAAIIEEFVTSQVAKVLRIPPSRLDREKPLNEQGLDSLMAVELFGVLENHLGVPIPPSQLIENPSIAKASAAIVRVLENQDAHALPSSAPAVAKRLHDPEQDRLALSAEIAALPPLAGPAPSSPPAAILLTGATGFFGPYLLAALLEETDAEVVCLVRASTAQKGLDRIRQRLHEAGFSVVGDILHQRVSAVPGDVGAPRFGLSENDWTGLGLRIDTVVHAAATVGHATDYADLRSVNVLGTMTVIEFASSGPLSKSLHYLSGAGVVGGLAPSSGERSIKSEHSPPDSLASLYNDYGRSKAVAEHLIATARGRGLAANVFRLAHLTSASEPDLSIRSQGVWLFAKACLALGCAPRSDLNLQITPATYSARRVARAIRDRLAPGVWHIVGSQGTSFDDLVSILGRLGQDLEQIERTDWLESAKSILARNAAYGALMPDDSLLESSVSTQGLLADATFRDAVPHGPGEDDDRWDPATFLSLLVPSP